MPYSLIFKIIVYVFAVIGWFSVLLLVAGILREQGPESLDDDSYDRKPIE